MREHTNNNNNNATTKSVSSLDNTNTSIISLFDHPKLDDDAIASSTRRIDIMAGDDGQGKSPRATTTRSYQAADDDDFAINTSALERAFPEFSDLPSSPSSHDDFDEDQDDDDDDFDLSIEAGRGAVNNNATTTATKPAVTKGQHHHRPRLDDSRNSSLADSSLDNHSIRSSSPAIRVDYLTTPPAHGQKLGGGGGGGGPPSRKAATSAASSSDKIRKDAQIRRASLVARNIKDNKGKPVKKSSPARRPATTVRGDISAQVNLALEWARREEAAAAHGKMMNSGSTNNRATTARPSTSAAPGNNDDSSILLPDLHNLSDLVSSPARSLRQTPARRFAPRRHHDEGTSTSTLTKDQHMALQSVPVPDDEKVLFISLRVLQRKLAELESTSAETRKEVEDVRRENAVLKGELERSYRTSQQQHYHHLHLQQQEQQEQQEQHKQEPQSHRHHHHHHRKDKQSHHQPATAHGEAGGNENLRKVARDIHKSMCPLSFSPSSTALHINANGGA